MISMNKHIISFLYYMPVEKRFNNIEAHHHYFLKAVIWMITWLFIFFSCIDNIMTRQNIYVIWYKNSGGKVSATYPNYD